MKERAPGKWQLRVYIGADPETGNPRQLSRTVKGGKREAQSALAKFVTEVEAGLAPLSGQTTVGELLARYVEYQTPLRSPTTIRGYRTVATRVTAKLGPVKVSKLTGQELDRAYRGWLAEGLSPATVHHSHALLSAALRQAVRWGVVPYAVTERASPPPLKSPPVKAVGVEDVRRLITAAEQTRSPTLATAVALAAITGARRGELCGLRWEDLDLTAGVIHIRRAVKTSLAGGIEVGPTKTHAERAVSLDLPTLAVLARHRLQVDSWAHAAGVEPTQTGYLLSAHPLGDEPTHPNSLGQAFHRVAQRCGVHIRFHDLRHFAATQLVGAGVDVRTVAERLGHADPSVTLRVYAAAMAARDVEAGAILGELVAG
jgi:integrase